MLALINFELSVTLLLKIPLHKNCIHNNNLAIENNMFLLLNTSDKHKVEEN